MPRTLLPLIAAGVAALSLAACDTMGTDRSTGTTGATSGSSGVERETPATGSSSVPEYADPAANMGVPPPYSEERNPSGNSR